MAKHEVRYGIIYKDIEEGYPEIFEIGLSFEDAIIKKKEYEAGDPSQQNTA